MSWRCLLLLLAGVRSLRAKPASGVAFLTAAWGWCGALAWRSYFLRVVSRERELGIYAPGQEWQETVLGWALLYSLAVLCACLWLAWRGGRPGAGER